MFEFSNLAKTWILDVDGTLVKHNGYKIDGYDTLLPGVVEFFGSLPSEDKVVLLTAIFTYEEYKISHTIGVKVKAKELSEAEYLKVQLFSELEKVFETSKEEQYVELPKIVNGKTVLYEENKSENGGGIVFFFVASKALKLVFSLVPGATPKKPASGFIAYNLPSGPILNHAISSPTVHTL